MIDTGRESDWPIARLCEWNNVDLLVAAPDLLAALKGLQKELRAHIKFDVKKHYSLMVADAATTTAIAKAEGEI